MRRIRSGREPDGRAARAGLDDNLACEARPGRLERRVAGRGVLDVERDRERTVELPLVHQAA